MSNDSTTSQTQTVLSLGVASETMKQLKTCFAQEKPEVQTAIKRMAAPKKDKDGKEVKAGRDYLVEYANYLFIATLEKQYKSERLKYVASYKPTIELMVRGGMERAAVLAAMSIEEWEFEEITDKQPTKGA